MIALAVCSAITATLAIVVCGLIAYYCDTEQEAWPLLGIIAAVLAATAAGCGVAAVYDHYRENDQRTCRTVIDELVKHVPPEKLK